MTSSNCEVSWVSPCRGLSSVMWWKMETGVRRNTWSRPVPYPTSRSKCCRSPSLNLQYQSYKWTCPSTWDFLMITLAIQNSRILPPLPHITAQSLWVWKAETVCVHAHIHNIYHTHTHTHTHCLQRGRSREHSLGLGAVHYLRSWVYWLLSGNFSILSYHIYVPNILESRYDQDAY